jgi:hypothetical protein
MFCYQSIYFISIHGTHLLKLADPGSIVQLGFSAGSRSLPCFDWVGNILSKRLSDDDIDALDQETAHVFSLFWMLIRRRLPSSVTDDLVDWMAETGIQRMNKDILRGFQEESNFGEIELDVGDNLFSFQWAEFTPPSGVMVANYSRYFQSIFPNFSLYNCDYGIRIQGGGDTIVAWDPSHFYGTSLQNYPPTSETISEFNQIGLAIVTPNHIPQLWKKYVAKQISLKELREAMESDDEDDEDEIV